MKDVDSQKIWAVVGNTAFQLNVAALVAFYRGGVRVPGEFQYQLTISKSNGTDAFVLHCNRRFIRAKVSAQKTGVSVVMTGEIKAERKEMLAIRVRNLLLGIHQLGLALGLDDSLSKTSDVDGR